MDLEKLDNELPNGFHDAELHDIRIDYKNGSLVLRMALDLGNPKDQKRESYRTGAVRVSGLYFCSIDPPDPNYPYVPDGTPLTVSGDPANADTFPELKELSPTLPPGVSCFRFFVHEWNSFINIAASGAEVIWD
jgi:hypothetical protein